MPNTHNILIFATDTQAKLNTFIAKIPVLCTELSLRTYSPHQINITLDELAFALNPHSQLDSLIIDAGFLRVYSPEQLASFFALLPKNLSRLKVSNDEILGENKIDALLTTEVLQAIPASIHTLIFEKCLEPGFIFSHFPTHITTLGLSCIQDDWCTEDWKSFLTVLPQSITSLDLSNGYSRKPNGQIFAAIPKNVTSLNIENCFLTHAPDFKDFAFIPSHITSLTIGEGTYYLSDGNDLKIPKTVTRLSIKGLKNFRSNDMLYRTEILAKIPGATYLDLSNNDFTDLNLYGLHSLPEGIKTIDLSHMKLKLKWSKYGWLTFISKLPNSVNEIIIKDRENQQIIAEILPCFKKEAIEQLLKKASLNDKLIELIGSYGQDDSNESNSFYKTSELKYEQLINTKLRRLTVNYLFHLYNEGKELNPKLNLCSKFPLEYIGTPENKERYDSIMAKYKVVCKLDDHLTAYDSLPSRRLMEFAKTLKKNTSSLSPHRNPDWQRYAKNCLVALGVLCTGIIPGIAFLWVWAAFDQKSSPLFFSKSHGEEYSDTMNTAIDTAFTNESCTPLLQHR